MGLDCLVVTYDPALLASIVMMLLGVGKHSSMCEAVARIKKL
jgi:hypothetical protein